MDRKGNLSSPVWLRFICALALSGALFISAGSGLRRGLARPQVAAVPSFTDFSTGYSKAVLTGGPAGAWDERVREKVQVIQDGGIYKMWYVGHPPGNTRASKVGYATSPDGKTWTKYAGNPIISRSSKDQDISVIKVGASAFRMYVEVNDAYIDLFTSTDGIHWSLHPSSPVKRNAASPVVWQDSGVWYMLYEAMVASPYYNIHLASSPDGISWTDNPANPVIAEDRDMAPDSVVKSGSVYHLYYHGDNRDTAWPAWHAVSTNLIQWTERRELIYNYSSQVTFVKSDGQIWSYVWNLMGDNAYYLRYGAQPAPLNGEYLYWNLDEGSGSVAYDSSGNGVNGQLRNSPRWTAGRVNGGLSFDGINDWVETNYNTDFSRWTMSAWVRSPAAPGSGQPSGPVHREMNFQLNWNHPSATFRGAAGVRVRNLWYAAKFGALNSNTWYHLAATYDGETLKAYKNGVLITTNAAPSGVADSDPLTLKLGRQALTKVFFRGVVDEVKVYQRALSASEVAGLAGSAFEAGVIRVDIPSVGAAADGLCSLAEALQAANMDAPVDACPAGQGGDTILLPPGDYSLFAGAKSPSGLEVFDSLTLAGEEGGPVTLDGGGLSQPFILGTDTAEIYLSNVEIANGDLNPAGDPRIQLAPQDGSGDLNPTLQSPAFPQADAADRPGCLLEDPACSPETGVGEQELRLWLPAIRQ